MTEDSAASVQLLRQHKVKLIEVLSADADFVLQHADSRSLLSPCGYQQVKSCRAPFEKMTELIDHVIQRGPAAAQGLLSLLTESPLQETFPLLDFVENLHNDRLSASLSTSERRTQIPNNRNGDEATELQVEIPAKKVCKNGGGIVKEKQLMTVARAIGRSWRQIGRLALDIPNVKLEQIEEDHSQHVERVFAMFSYWRSRLKEGATAAHLHSLLSQEDLGVLPESIDFLLEPE